MLVAAIDLLSSDALASAKQQHAPSNRNAKEDVPMLPDCSSSIIQGIPLINRKKLPTITSSKRINILPRGKKSTCSRKSSPASSISRSESLVSVLVALGDDRMETDVEDLIDSDDSILSEATRKRKRNSKGFPEYRGRPPTPGDYIGLASAKQKFN